jgi:hypothetical protein
MKKIAILFSVIALGSLCAMAQGNITFANNGTGQLLSISPNANGSGATLLGTNAQSVSLGGGPGQVIVRLYVQTNGVPVTFNSDGTPVNMFLVGTTTNSGLTPPTFQGTFNGGSPLTMGAPWDGSFAIEYYFWAQTMNGLYRGTSTLGINYTPTTGTTLPVATFGTNPGQVLGFTLTPVPEPSTFALCGLGAAALLLFRRRKS